MGEQARKHQISGLSLLFAGMLSAGAAAPPDTAAVDALSQSQLEQRLKVIDSKLANLASFSLRGGVGSVGFRSLAHPGPAKTEWVRIDLDQEFPIDEVVLVPTIWRDTKTGFRQDGFPEEFRIVAGTIGDEKGMEVASFTAEHGLLPRIAPVIVPCHGLRASWVRVEATLLSPRAWDQLHDFELAEILVFSGNENVALHQSTQASSHQDNESNRQKERLVDGFMPYLMDAADGDQSSAFVIRLDVEARPVLTFDLGSLKRINRIHLHAVDTSDNVPQSTPSDYGIPKRLRVEGAERPDFSDAVPLLEFHAETIFDTGPINMLSFPEVACRFLRLTVVEPYVFANRTRDDQYFGFAEIEIFSNGENVAQGIPALANFKTTDPMRPLSALTDGLNLYGTILPIRDWLRELALRHDLETERPLVLAALNHRYARQKIRLVWMGWLTTVLAAGIVLTILIDRMLRMRHVARIRERFAADLHDELGADLHSIRLLGELALAAKDAPDRLDRVLRNSQEIAQRASLAVRHCMNMQEANGLYGSLREDMERAAQRIMAQLEYDIAVEGEDFLQRLKPRTKTDLFLFFKECLVNISRHADATRFSTRLTANHKELQMIISDNGRGLPDSSAKGVPKSLKRRARLLGAHVAADHSDSGGTRITLKLPTRRFGFRK
jgi:signal transduction histidine kinase